MGTWVAASDGSGLITGTAMGTAQVSAAFFGVSGQTLLTVTAATPVSVAISPPSSALAKGRTQRFTAISTLSDGTTQDVTALAAWTARDTMGSSVASIDSSGLARATGTGSATISCAYRGSTATALLTVTARGTCRNYAVAVTRLGLSGLQHAADCRRHLLGRHYASADLPGAVGRR